MAACNSALFSSARCTLEGAAFRTRSPTSGPKAPKSGISSFLGRRVQSVQGPPLRGSRAAPIARAAVSTSAPKTSTAGNAEEPSWLELHGVNNWEGLLPAEGRNINETLKNEIIKYGEMAQLTYDSVDLYPWSRYRDQNRFTQEIDNARVPGDLLGKNLVSESFFEQLPGQGYAAVAYIYASERSPTIKKLRDKTNGQVIRRDVWLGYIAYSEEKKDIVVAYRGTQQPAEWVADGEVSLMSYSKYDPEGHRAPPSVGSPVVKALYAAAAFAGATLWGSLSAFTIAAVLYLVFKLFESDSLLGAIYTGAFAAVAALPVSKLLKKEGGEMSQFVIGYALAVLGLDTVVNLLTPASAFWSVNSVIFLVGVIIPTGVTAAVEAWDSADEGPQVHEGFYELYDPTADGNKMLPKSGKSPRKVVHETLAQLLKEYPDTETISVSGHSLGAALAVLTAYDIVDSGSNISTKGDRLPVACFSFEGPRVGNPKFVESFKELKKDGLAAIRLVNKPDIVTQVPKAFYLQNVYYILAAITNNDTVVDIIDWVEELGYKLKLPSAFQHVNAEQQLLVDSRQVDYLKKMPGFNPLNNLDSIGYYHNLEVNLHLLSGFFSDTFTRDFALCNKSADVIDERAGIPPGWFATIIQNVGRSKGGALIEPYSAVLPPLDGEDNERKIGEGPVAPESGKCEPLVRNYFERYLGVKPPVKKQLWELLDNTTDPQDEA